MDFIRSLLDRFNGTTLPKKKAEPTSVRQPERASPAEISPFLSLISELDGEAIEGARDLVKEKHLKQLIEHYWTLEDWDQKMCLVDLIQDQAHDELRKLMLDYLRVPPTSDSRQIAQATALGFVDEEYDQFMRYYNDRELLGKTVAQVLKAEGLSPAPRPVAKVTKNVPVAALEGAADERILKAAELGHLGEYNRALEDGANIDSQVPDGNRSGCNVLMLALMNRHYTLAMTIIEGGADIHFRRPSSSQGSNPKRGQTALWWAANFGQLGLLDTLLEVGADVNAQDHHGGTPLHQAASSGHLDCVRFLVERGADINLRISDGRKPFQLANTNGLTEIVKYLMLEGNDVNERCRGGWTPLMSAAFNGHKDLVEFFVEQGADVNAKHQGLTLYRGMKGCTPLYYAVSANRVRMTKYLLKHGADATLKMPGKNGPRSLLDCGNKQKESIRKALLEAGATED